MEYTQEVYGSQWKVGCPSSWEERFKDLKVTSLVMNIMIEVEVLVFREFLRCL